MLTTLYIQHIYAFMIHLDQLMYLYDNFSYIYICLPQVWSALLVRIQFNCYALLAKMFGCTNVRFRTFCSMNNFKHCSKLESHVFHFPIENTYIYIYSINRTCPWRTRFLWCNKNYFQLIFR